MLKWFNKQSTSSSLSKKPEESHQYSQSVNSALTENDYEFLFNQLLDGVAHGWHLGKIIKFFSNLEPRSNITQWIDWVERFEKKINYSPDPSQKKVGAIMMRFGELTKPNDDLQKLGLLFYRIGNQLFLGRTADIIWEYAGQDVARLEPQPAGIHASEPQEQFSDLAVESNGESLNHANSSIADLDHSADFVEQEDRSRGDSSLEQDLNSQNGIEHSETDLAEQNNLDSLTLEENLASQDVSSELEDVNELEPLAHDQTEQIEDISFNEENLAAQQEEEVNEQSVVDELSPEEDLTTRAFEENLAVQQEEEATAHTVVEEFSPEEDLINRAFEENLAAQQEEEATEPVSEQSLDMDDSALSEDALINQAFEEKLSAQQEDVATAESFPSKFSPEEELINQAFESELAAQSKRSEASSSQSKEDPNKVKDKDHIDTKDRAVVLDLSLDLAPEDLESGQEDRDRRSIDTPAAIRDVNQEASEVADSHSENVNGFAPDDVALDSGDNFESQSLEVNGTDLEIASSQFSVGSFLEATEALSNNKGIANRQVNFTWDEFVVALEKDPVLAQNVAQQLGLVGVNTPQEIVQAAVNRFSNQKQSSLTPANLELVKSWFQLGLKQASAKDFQGAIASWDQALRLNPNLSEAWHNKGSALGRLGKYIEAIQSFDHAVRIDPDSYQAWNDRAHALYKMQEWPKAIASWDRAIQIMPDRHQFWYNRGCALEQIKSFDESIASYEKALEIKPDFQPARSRHTVLIANNF